MTTAWVRAAAAFACGCVLFLGAAGAPAQAATTGPKAASHEEAAASVSFRNEVLFEVRSPLGTLTPAERAATISDRLQQAASGSADIVERIRTVEHSDVSDLYAGDRLIATLTDLDAAMTGRTRAQLAADDAYRVRQALEKELHGRSLRGILQALLGSIAVTLVAGIGLWLFGIGYRRAEVRLHALVKTHSARVPLPQLAIFSPNRIADAVVALARLGRLTAILLVIYFYLNAVLGMFPWTRGLAEQLWRYVGSAFGFVVFGILGYLPKIGYIAAAVIATRFVIKLARLLFAEIERGTLTLPGFYPEWADPTFKILRFLIFALAAVVIFPLLPGSSSPAFKGVSVFLGVLFSFGSASAIGNVIGGIVLTYMRPFHAGDRVRVGDTTGDVISKNLLVVRLRTIKNVEVTIPNSLVLSNHIINYSTCAGKLGLILHTSVTIGYSTPWEKVHELLIAAAGNTAGLLKEPAPFVLQTQLDDFYVHYEINAYTREANEMVNIYSRLRTNIQVAFHSAGVEIMSPHYTSLRDGNAIEIPDPNLPPAYEAPAFRLFSLGARPPGGRKEG